MNEHVPAKLFIAALYAHRSVTKHSIHKSAEQTVAIRRPTQQKYKKLRNSIRNLETSNKLTLTLNS